MNSSLPTLDMRMYHSSHDQQAEVTAVHSINTIISVPLENSCDPLTHSNIDTHVRSNANTTQTDALLAGGSITNRPCGNAWRNTINGWGTSRCRN